MTKAAIQMTPGDDMHLTLLMAPHSLNFVTGQDREHLLAFGRAAFEAGRTTAEQGKCLHQIAEPAASVEQQIEEVMGLADAFVEATQANGAWFYNDKTNTARNAIDEKLRTLLSSSQSVEQAAPQAVQAAVPKWIDDPHDIEQGQMLNPKWVKLQQSDAPAHPADGVPAQAVQVAVPLPTVEMIGVKDGKETNLGQVPMPPTMRARELLRDVGFTGLDDDDGEGAYAMGVCEQLIEYCQAYYAAPAHPAEGVPAAEAVEQIEAPSDGQAFEHWVSNCDSSGIQYHGPSYERGFLTGKTVAADEAEALAATQPAAHPVATITGLDEFGPLLGWHEHWVKFPVGTNFYTQPAAQGVDAPSEAARSVLAERARQITAEGYTPEQDDGYNPGVLALHGGLYACHAYDNLAKKRAPEGWQWDEKWWKPKDPRSNLVKAGALVLAEIERMDRSFAAQAKQGEQANG